MTTAEHPNGADAPCRSVCHCGAARGSFGTSSWLIQVDYRFTHWSTGGPMADVNDVLATTRAAVIDFVAAAERSASTWTTPRAPRKWSPSQIVEHVARCWEESAKVVSGAPSMPMPPAFLRLVGRLFFYR